MEKDSGIDVTIDEMAALLGGKDIEIYLLRKEIRRLNEVLAAMEKPKDGSVAR
jgi:hypothetical protein